MKAYFGVLALIIIISISTIVLTNKITGHAVVEKDPCRIIKCNVRLFGFWQTKAQMTNITEDGRAVCHCPQDPEGVDFYVAIMRKY